MYIFYTYKMDKENYSTKVSLHRKKTSDIQRLLIVPINHFVIHSLLPIIQSTHTLKNTQYNATTLKHVVFHAIYDLYGPYKTMAVSHKFFIEAKWWMCNTSHMHNNSHKLHRFFMLNTIFFCYPHNSLGKISLPIFLKHRFAKIKRCKAKWRGKKSY